MTAIHHIQITDDEATGLIRFELDRAFGLVLLTAARRDLNAMSMAPGASPETRAIYAGYAGMLGRAAARIPQVDLLITDHTVPVPPAPPEQITTDGTGDPLEDLLG